MKHTKPVARPNVDRVMWLADRFTAAVQTVLAHADVPGLTVDEVLAAYTYAIGQLLLGAREGQVAPALADAAMVTDRLPAVIRDVLGPVVPRTEGH